VKATRLPDVERDYPADEEEREERPGMSAQRLRPGAGAAEGHQAGGAATHFSSVAARASSEGRSATDPGAPAAVAEESLLAQLRGGDPLRDAPAHLAATIAADLERDPTLNARLSASSAHLSLETDAGPLTVHVRLQGREAEVHLVGAAAPLLAARHQDLGSALAARGLALSAVRVGEALPTEPSAEPSTESTDGGEVPKPAESKPPTRPRGRLRVKA
jgi:hypothetical protein